VLVDVAIKTSVATTKLVPIVSLSSAAVFDGVMRERRFCRFCWFCLIRPFFIIRLLHSLLDNRMCVLEWTGKTGVTLLKYCFWNIQALFPPVSRAWKSKGTSGCIGDGRADRRASSRPPTLCPCFVRQKRPKTGSNGTSHLEFAHISCVGQSERLSGPSEEMIFLESNHPQQGRSVAKGSFRLVRRLQVVFEKTRLEGKEGISGRTG
jgi:hypothetical protein